MGAEAGKLGSRDGESGADEERLVRQTSAGEDSAESGGAGAAGEAHDEGFELIVGVMAGRDDAAAGSGREAVEGGVSEAAGGRLDAAGFAWDLHGVFEVRDTEGTGEIADEVGVGLGFGRRAQVVDDVGEGVEAACGVEREGEGDGVGAAGAGDDGAAVRVLDAASAGQATPPAEDLRDSGVTFGQGARGHS